MLDLELYEERVRSSLEGIDSNELAQMSYKVSDLFFDELLEEEVGSLIQLEEENEKEYEKVKKELVGKYEEVLDEVYKDEKTAEEEHRKVLQYGWGYCY